MFKQGKIISINISTCKGVSKTKVDSAELIEDWGIEGDVHAGKWHRQISLLAVESIQKMRDLGSDVQPGAFGENITTEFLSLPNFKIGDLINIGPVILEVTQIGKDCHNRCAIYYNVGDCIMPREGIFAKVIKGGKIFTGDKCEVINAGHKKEETLTSNRSTD